MAQLSLKGDNSKTLYDFKVLSNCFSKTVHFSFFTTTD